MLELFRDSDWYLVKFKYAHHTPCCNYNFLGILREALQVNHMLVRSYLSVMTEQRQRLSLPFYWEDFALSTEIGELMASDQIRGPFFR